MISPTKPQRPGRPRLAKIPTDERPVPPFADGMHGTLLGPRHGRPCRADRRGTHRCVIRDATGRRYVYWNPFHAARVRLPKGVHHLQGVLGAVSTVQPGSTLKVGYKPVMVSR